MEHYSSIDNDFSSWKADRDKNSIMYSAEARQGSNFIYENLKQLDMILAKHKGSMDKSTRQSIALIKGERRMLEKQLSTGDSYIHRLATSYSIPRVMFRVYRLFKARNYVKHENRVVNDSIVRISDKIDRLGHPHLHRDILKEMAMGMKEILKKDSLQINPTEKVDFSLGFRKTGDGYVMNNYTVTHTDSKNPGLQTSYEFNVSNNSAINKDQAAHLVQGRPIEIITKTPHGPRLDWVELDLKNKDENGKNILKRVENGQKFNLDRVIQKTGLNKVLGEAECFRIKDRLRKGEEIDISHPRIGNGEKLKLSIDIHANEAVLKNKTGEKVEMKQNVIYPRAEKFRLQKVKSAKQKSTLGVSKKAS